MSEEPARLQLGAVEFVGLSVVGIVVGVVGGPTLAALGIAAFNSYHPPPSSAGEIAVSRGASIYFIVMTVVFVALSLWTALRSTNRPALRLIAGATSFTILAIFALCDALFASNLTDPRY